MTRRRVDFELNLLVRDLDEELLKDLELARVALGVWRAQSPIERRVAELRGLLARMPSHDDTKRRALEAYLATQEQRLANAPLQPDSDEEAIDMAEFARAAVIERYLGMVAGMVEALGQAAHGRVLDLIGAGNLALDEAARSFEPGPHAGRDEFEAYARERVERAIADKLQTT